MRWLTALLGVSFLGGTGCGDDAAPVDESGTGSSGDPSSSSTGPLPTTSSTGPDDTTSSTTEAEESSSTGEPTPPPPPLEWITDCTVGGANLGVLHPDLECTSIEVPLDWDDPDGETIVVAALRVATSVQPRLGQMWMLDGGPGGSGLGYFGDTTMVADVTAAGWDYVVPAHRGTLSPSLDCDPFDSLSQDCRDLLEDAWGEGLRHFNTRWAGRDVGEYIRRTQGEFPDERTIVYGASYGTYWAQFYVAEHPDQAEGIVLDSVVPPDADLALEEFIVQDRAVHILQACVDDPDCGPRVGFASGEAFSDAVIAAIDGGECGTGDIGLWEDSSFRYSFGQVLNTHRVRNYLPLLGALLARCDTALTATVNNGINALFTAAFSDMRPIDALPLGGPWPRDEGDLPPGIFGDVPFDLYSSPTLQALVMGTTMLRPDADPDAAALAARNHFATLGFGDWAATTNAAWGDLPDVEFDREFVTEVPLLILNARYDLQTVFPWAEQVGTHQEQAVHEFADGQHALAFAGTGGKFPDGGPCSRQLMLDFAAAPARTLDASCVDELPDIDPNLARPDLQELSMAAFGTIDPWSLLPP